MNVDVIQSTASQRAAAGPSLSPHAIFVRYVTFAIIAGVCNLLTQEGTLRVAPSDTIIPSILAGTAVGFVVKYVLDKRFIFFDPRDSHAAEMRKVLLYGFFSVLTTMLFWAVEISAWHVFQTVEAKYIGAVIGLSLGNWIKYRLDKHYVFGSRVR